MLDPARLPTLPTFTPAAGPSPGLDLLAAAASDHSSAGTSGSGAPAIPRLALHSTGPYNAAASLPPKAVKKIMSLEFVEMSELQGDIWSDDVTSSDASPAPRRQSKPPVDSIKTWLECFARMASVLVTSFPEKAPELWAYHTTILKAAHNYEGANWVAYDRQFRRDMLARKDLNWSMPNTRLYNEAFTSRARTIPRCPHCLAEDHSGTSCPHNPNPPIVGWFHGPTPMQFAPSSQLQPSHTARSPAQHEVCRNYNTNRCRFSRCRFRHVCTECGGAHPASNCPQRPSTYRGTPSVGRTLTRAHPNQPSSSSQAP